MATKAKGVQASVQDVPRVKRRPSNAYPKGVSGNPSGKAKPKPETPDGLTDAARMRLVAEQAPARDANSAQRALRAVYDKNPLSFIKLMVELERSERVGSVAGSGVVELGPDVAEERVLVLIEELLAEACRRGSGPRGL